MRAAGQTETRATKKEGELMPRDWNLPLTYLPKVGPVKQKKCTQTIRFCTISRAKNNRIKGKGTLSTYGDRDLGEGRCYPNCKFAGKYHAAENDCNCSHPETGDIFFCATHHIKGQPKCPVDLLPGKIIRKQVGDRVRFYRWTGRPYWSHPEYITEYMVLDQVDDIQISPGGIKTKIDIDVLPWNHGLCELLANLDFIDPPTGEALRDVLIEKNSKIPAEGAPAQILRWKP